MCGGNYYTTSGVLRSPGWPANYGHGRECTWIIREEPAINNVHNILWVIGLVLRTDLQHVIHSTSLTKHAKIRSDIIYG